MKKGIMMLCTLLVVGFGAKGSFAASGKCTVVQVDGTRMVIECNEQAKGFTQGNQIKIKTEKQKDTLGK